MTDEEETEMYRISLDIAHDDMGVYPRTVTRNGEETKRTEWQEGWNAYGTELLENTNKVFSWLNGKPQQIIDLITSEVLNVTVKDSKVIMFVNCNDLFYWGCADAEEISETEIDDLIDFMKLSEKHGAQLWACRKRKMRPQKPCYEYFTHGEKLLFDACGEER